MQFCELVVSLNAWFEVNKKGKVIDFLIAESLNRSCSALQTWVSILPQQSPQ